ncbi:MAG: hypothetical protein V7637_2394 [Mycobacteriales bacterium]
MAVPGLRWAAGYGAGVASAIFELCDEYVTRAAVLDPVWGTMRGVAGAPAGGTDFGPDGQAARADLVRDTLRRLGQLEPSTVDDRAAASHLAERLSVELEWHDTGESLRTVRAPFGPVSVIRDSVELVPHRDADGWAQLAERLAAVPFMLGTWRAGVALGLERGRPAARRQALETARQAERYSGSAGAAPTHAAIVESGPDGPLRTELAAAADAAHAAYAETARWLRAEYAPRAAEADGVGAERHALFRRMILGADVDPVEAYEWAWAELHRIEDEISAEVERIQPGATVDEAIAALDRTGSVDSTGAYRDWLQQRHDRAIEQLNGVHFDIAAPLRTVEVTLAPGSSAGAPYYTPPNEDFSRPGKTWWPLGDRTRFAVWSELTTVFHEGVPGHHLQLGQARLMGDRLSRYSRVSGVPGHSEGWALYAERLADDLGWFAEPGQRFGMLKASALRAARVVIDYGLHLDLPLPPAEAERHGPQWTFEVATEVLRDRGRIAPHRLHAEVVRYCGWPAQASAYKLGERIWLAARDDARQRAGASFDLKQWHTRALSLGPIGLGGLGAALRAADA